MKTTLRSIRNVILVVSLFTTAPSLRGQGTALTYQGRLNDVAGPASGKYEFQFTVLDALTDGNAVGVNPLAATLTVSNGLFTVTLDPGAGVFTGADRWLEIAVRSTGEPLFTTLSPRQKIAATPYAITAGTVTGTIPLAQLPPALVTDGASGVNLSGTFTGNGAGLTGLNASQLTGGTVPVAALGNAWKTTGNAGTTPGAQFLGTTDNQPLELQVNGGRALRLEPTAGGFPNLIGGVANTVGAGTVGATIAGGGFNNIGTNSHSGAIGGGGFNNIAASSSYATIAGGIANNIGTNSVYSVIGGGRENNIADNSSSATIAGGYLNDIGTNSFYSAIGGGYFNNIAANATSATIAGGYVNSIGTYSYYSAVGGGFANNIAATTDSATIAGGISNDIGTNSDFSAVGGGRDNDIADNSDYSTIGGGDNNNVGANSQYATIPGGNNNFATNRAFAAGTRARANHEGAFVWGDSTPVDIASAAANSVTMRASGGYRLFSNSGATAGVFLTFGGTAWGVISDRNVKKDFTPVDSREVLEKLAALPITRWHYQWEEAQATPHLGPMAQDFKAAFYPGRDDKSITTQETDGVALAAIQGLNQKVEAGSQRSEDRIQKLEAENVELKRQMVEIKNLLSQVIDQTEKQP